MSNQRAWRALGGVVTSAVAARLKAVGVSTSRPSRAGTHLLEYMRRRTPLQRGSVLLTDSQWTMRWWTAAQQTEVAASTGSSEAGGQVGAHAQVENRPIPSDFPFNEINGLKERPQS